MRCAKVYEHFEDIIPWTLKWCLVTLRNGEKTDRENQQFEQENLGPNRTRTNNIWKISDRTEPGPTKFEKSRTEPDQDQKNLENLGPSRTDRSSDQAVRGSLV